MQQRRMGGELSSVSSLPTDGSTGRRMVFPLLLLLLLSLSLWLNPTSQVSCDPSHCSSLQLRPNDTGDLASVDCPAPWIPFDYNYLPIITSVIISEVADAAKTASLPSICILNVCVSDK